MNTTRYLVIWVWLWMTLLSNVNVTAQDRYASHEDRPFELKKASSIVDENPLKSLEILELFLKKYSRSVDPKYQSEAYHVIGNAYFNLEQFDLAIINYKRALGRVGANTKYKRSIVSSSVDPEIFYDLSLAYKAGKNWDEALKYGEQYITTNSNKSATLIKGELNIAEILFQQKKLDKALEYAEHAQQLAHEQGEANWQLEADYLVGSILEEKRDFDNALSNLNQAMVLADSLSQNDKGEDIAEAIGRNYRAQNALDKELNFKAQRRQRSIDIEDPEQQNKLDLEIAELYIDLEKSEDAVAFLEESVQLSEQLGDLEKNVSARKSLSDVYASRGNYNEALENYRKYVALVDQLYENKQKEIELTSEIQKDLYKKQETISLLEKDQELHENQIELLRKDAELQNESIEKQQLFIYGLTVMVALIIFSAYLLFRNVQKKKLANQLLAVKSLRSQMNPHFIFNALNSVNSFISKNDTRQANKYLSDFSRLMRTVMENSQKDFVPLSEELEVLQLYLKLEHFRFQDKFDYALDVNPDIPVDEFQIPPMLIQPYIENAIWHGLRYKEEKGHLDVLIDLKDDKLILKICDDGIGRKRSQELKTPNQRSQQSTGMRNTKNRIHLLNKIYQSNISTIIQDISENEKTGTHVTVTIPREMTEETV